MRIIRTSGQSMKDFFISYNREDKKKAEWIAWILEKDNKYSVEIQAWDFKPGENFVLKMDNALKNCKKTIGVLSDAYLASLYTQIEWTSVFADDPTGANGNLILVRVSECKPSGLLKANIYIDLVELDEEKAKKTLLSEIAGNRRKPLEQPPWGEEQQSDKYQKDTLQLDIKDILGLLQTTKVTFNAQAKVRNNLYQKVRSRLNVPRLQYEEFFRKYYYEMNEEEKVIHKTIRGFTENILFEYNSKILKLINKNKSLLEPNSITQLRNHLVIWLSKYNSIFKDDESMCLIYAGVAEKVPFPPDRILKEDLEKLLK